MNEFRELGSAAVDLSQEFEAAGSFQDFKQLLRQKRTEPAIKITYQLKSDETDLGRMRNLKAFLETGYPGQERFVVVKATPEQYKKFPNEFSSGIKWEKI